MLGALVAAGARGLYGSYFDKPLAQRALAAGVGATIKAVFNSEQRTAFGARLEVEARVHAVSTEPFVGRLDYPKTHSMRVLCAEIGGEGGILVVVISNRYQTADPMFFEHFSSTLRRRARYA